MNNIPIKTELLENFRRLTYKLLNKHLHYINEFGELDLPKVLADYDELLKVVALSNPTDEIRNYRIMLGLSLGINLLVTVAFAVGYITVAF